MPFALYSDPEIFNLEMERIFGGASWAYVGLAAEIPESGDFKTTFIGNRSVIICRDRKGAINGFVNRCSHKGVKLCREKSGNQKMFTCPYHRWNYDLQGDLRGVPFIRGVKKQGGMPEDFDMKSHGLPKLQITEHNGVIFASLADEPMPPLEDYLGEANLHYFTRVFDGRELRLLGFSRQLIPANWKLMFENIKDPYHASLLHVFLVTFGLFRADQKASVKMDASGKHGLLISQKGEQKKSEHTT
ncbi:MAG: aromatic ring-hydroxylating oxygenase subunit alpha, partial [Woeseiaceae bacterium]